MLSDGIYKYYTINDDKSRSRKGLLKIINQHIYIVEDPFKILSHMFEEGEVTRKTEDIMKSVNRNHYAVFVKDNGKVVKSQEELDEIEKGEIADKIKTGVAGLALAASTAMAPQPTAKLDMSPKPPIAQQANKYSAGTTAQPNKEKDRILNSIMDVESSGNQNRIHQAPAHQALHGKERAYGGYGLMPMTIRETFKANPKMFESHKKAHTLMGSDLHNYMDANPGLEKQVASAHYDKLAKIFGDDPAKIGYAWLNGVTGTNRAIKNGVDINNHWHVLKVLKAYQDRKKKAN